MNTIEAYNDGNITDAKTIELLQNILDANRTHTMELSYDAPQDIVIEKGGEREITTKTIVTDIDKGGTHVDITKPAPFIPRKTLINRKQSKVSTDESITPPPIEPPPVSPPGREPKPGREEYQLSGQSSQELQSMTTSVHREGKSVKRQKAKEQRRTEQASKDTGGKAVELDEAGHAVPAPRRAGAGTRERTRTGRNDHNPTSVSEMRRELARDARAEQEDMMQASLGGEYDQDTELEDMYTARFDDEAYQEYDDSVEETEMSEVEALAAYGIAPKETDEQKAARYIEDEPKDTSPNPETYAPYQEVDVSLQYLGYYQMPEGAQKEALLREQIIDDHTEEEQKNIVDMLLELPEFETNQTLLAIQQDLEQKIPRDKAA
jgi:hypothetical protein